MVHALPNNSRFTGTCQANAERWKPRPPKKKSFFGRLIFLMGVAMMAPLLLAEGNPQVTSVDPSMGKVNDSVTIAGQNLDKATVVAVFLSDDKNDYKATILDQSAEKIVMKVPQVKAGNYNISVQSGTNILIKPIRFTVEE
jgi:hypothetical protein